MSEKFEILINDPHLYPPEFVIKYGYNSYHWELESWQRRERSLLHDMMCILLSNLEPSENSDDIIIKSMKRAADTLVGGKKKRRRHHSNTRLSEDSFDTSSNDSENSDVEAESSEDELIYEDYDPIKEFEEMHEGILKYRYIVLEGSSNASELQNHFVKKWGMLYPSKMFDIVDSKEKKLVEVKTTTNLPRILNEYSKQKDTGENTALITVDLGENEITCHNKLDDMPGLSKAYNFLIKERQ